MKLPNAKVLVENKKYKLTYDIKAIFSFGFVLSINYEFVALFFGLTLIKKSR